MGEFSTELIMWWKKYTEADLKTALDAVILNGFFTHNEGTYVTILTGRKVTRTECTFTKGERYGQMERPFNFLPVGTLGHALLENAPYRENRDGTYEAYADVEEYSLGLTKNGLEQKIIHFFRNSWEYYALGPDALTKEAMLREITLPNFTAIEVGTFREGKSEYRFEHILEESAEEIIFYSGLPLRKIIALVKKVIAKPDPWNFTPRVTKCFPTLTILGIENNVEGTRKTINGPGKCQELPVRNGKVIYPREKFGFSGGGIVAIK